MRFFLLLSLILLPSILSAQKIRESKVDDFTGEKVIYTSWEKFKSGNGLSGKNNFVFSFRYENKTVYMHIKWVTADLTSIEEGAQLIFKLNNGDMVNVKALQYVISAKGLGATGLSMSAIEGIDPIYIGDFELFAGDNFAEKMRVYTRQGYVDVDLKEKDARKINEAYKLLIKEMNK